MQSENKFLKLKNKIFSEDINKLTLWWAFAVYLILLIWVIGFKYNSEWLPELGKEMRALPFKQRIVLTPFRYWGDFSGILDSVLNVIIYVPFGMFLLLTMLKLKWWGALIIVVFSSLIFEISQYFTGFGGCDITDLICNTLGGGIGIAIYCIFRSKVKDKAINIVTFVVSVVGTPVALFAIINTIINWRLYIIS